jgi:hypothetical protein
MMASAFNHAKPDKTKLMFLKAYDGLNEAVIAMGNNQNLFANKYETADGNGQTVTFDITNCPFLDINAPSDPDFDRDEYSGKLKFARLLQFALKGTALSRNPSSSVKFKSGPGNYIWTVSPIGEPVFKPENQKISFANEVKLNIDNSEEFTFCIQPNGDMQILDSAEGVNKGLTYLKNRTKVKSTNDSGYVINKTACVAYEYDISHQGNRYVVSDEGSEPEDSK